MITRKINFQSMISIMLITMFSLASFTSPWTREVFYICGYLCIIYIASQLLKNNSLTLKRADYIIPYCLLLFGIARIIWAIYNHKHSDYLNDIYECYEGTGKRLIVGSIIIYTVILLREKITPLLQNYYISLLVKILPIAVLGYALYQYKIINMPRIELSTTRATATAYIISPIFLISLHLCLEQANRHRDILLVILNLFSSTLTILLTQTRAAFLVYLVLALGTTIWVLHNRVSWKIIAAVTSSLMVIMILSYKPLIKPRMIQAIQETEDYNVATASGSLSARFAMWDAGIYVFKQHPLGQSAESRYTLIQNAVEHKQISSFIMQFLSVHLHNEIIETLSLQGLWGTLLLIIVYLSLLLTSLIQRNLLLLLTTLNLIGYGLSDVLFFSREVTITYLICIALSLVLGRQRTENEYRPL
ncbi:O-antigen ligase domain protein [Edwardsiella tarda ATCC 23685]|uniref:O-antigen ligase domain protein n=2 Tax=Edwardsiella tarda TaxID=636 RepID=D4F9Q7_EDWTA|nr:O-antigen ligase domain protein [Edwardsiella tarda ATCC 23685]GAC65824.1 O-antigen ligase [Edwardsiella tarda ATCC 15947 = NBRC 105688]STD50005.1 O-antigen ligase [Edwardsiella tarda]